VGFIFAIACAASLILTPLVRALAWRLNAVDWPDGWRKLHPWPVALWGGVGVFLSLVAGLVASLLLPVGQTATFANFTTTLLVSGGLVFLLGFVDDLYDLAGRVKLGLQIVAVVPIIVAGYWCDQVMIFGYAFRLGYFGIPLTILWLVGCLNAVNLLDGMDGCASVVGIIGATAAAVVAQTYGQYHTMPVAAALVGSLVGFLFFNRPPATIYLGDTGSTLIGLVVGLVCLEGGSNSSGQLAVAVPLVLMTIPVWDTTLAIVRRRLTGRRFDAADRGHLHHRLLETGFRPWQALAIVAALSATTATAAIVAARTGQGYLGWGTTIAVIVLLASRHWFGAYEFSLVRIAAVRQFVTLVSRLSLSAKVNRRFRLLRPERMGFESAWQMLTDELAACSVRHFELRLRNAGELQLGELQTVHVWSSGDETLSQPDHPWRLAMSFEGTHGNVCEVIVQGGDAAHSESWYLPRVAYLLRIFGQYWATHPDQVPEQKHELGLPTVAHWVRWQRRSAA
jgi:UDP-GlcNAc:undecaprenyl-phosphate GlcNAc-1-phosphate transferase